MYDDYYMSTQDHFLRQYSKSSSHLTFVQIKTNLPAEEDEDAAHVSVASGGSPATKNL